MDTRRMFELAQALAVAKSRQDLPAALRLLHADMVLESPAFGTTARGSVENLSVLCAQSGVSTDAVRNTLFGTTASEGGRR